MRPYEHILMSTRHFDTDMPYLCTQVSDVREHATGVVAAAANELEGHAKALRTHWSKATLMVRAGQAFAGGKLT
jgi:hypothetical protein